MEMVGHVLENTQDKPQYVLDAMLDTIRKNLHLNPCCLLLKNCITAENIAEHTYVIKNMLRQFRYERIH